VLLFHLSCRASRRPRQTRARAPLRRRHLHRRQQRAGGPVEEIRPGDVVWIAPGEKHWHGATPTTPMTHIAVVERLNGKNIDWLEKVSDEQYRR
jgi:hypothetical protein